MKLYLSFAGLMAVFMAFSQSGLAVKSDIEYVKPDPTRGQEIMDRVQGQRPSKDVVLKVSFHIKPRKFESKACEGFIYNHYEKGSANTILQLTSPDDMKGTSILAAYEQDQSRFHVFDPVTKNVVEKTGAAVRESFAGTDLSLEDLNFAFLEWPGPLFIGTARRNSRDTFVVKLTPPPGSASQYGHIIIWVDQEYYAPFLAEAFDKEGKPLKTLFVSEVKKFDSQWSIKRLRAVTIPTGQATRMEIADSEVNVKIDPSYFTPDNFYKITPPKFE